MNANKKGKNGKGKNTDINEFYSKKPIEEKPSELPQAQELVSKPEEPINNENTNKWKRVANDEPSQTLKMPDNQEEMVEPTMPQQLTEATADAPQKQSNPISSEIREEGPPPVCKLNQAPQEQNQSVIEAMQQMIINQQKMLDMMHHQLQHQVHPQPIPFGYPMPMNWVGPMTPMMMMPQASQAPQVPQTPQAQAPQVQTPVPQEPQVSQAKAPEAPKAKPKKEDEEHAEFAPFDLKLNVDCPAGFKCPNSKKPSACPKNHNFYGPIIKKGNKLPQFFCKWERPWKKGPNGKALRCRNSDCYNSHLEGRDDFLGKLNSTQQQAQ